MQLDHLAHLLGDRVQRIERGHRLLENDGDAPAPHLAHILPGHAQDILAIKQDLSRGVGRRRIRQQAQDRERRDRFSRAGFPDQRDRLAQTDLERDAS